MKYLLLTTIAAVLVVGCGESVSIHEAAKLGNIEIVKHAIADGVDVNKADKTGNTLLEIATIEGHKGIVELLISNGADVNARNENGFTALHSAAFFRHKEIVELLINKGSDVNAIATSWKGMSREKKMTPLDWMNNSRNIIEGTDEIADLLRKHGGKTGEELEAAEPVAEVAQPEQPTAKASDWSIHEAARTGNIEAVKQHLAAGTDVNAKGYGGSTPLQYAANKEIAELLIAEGADVTAKGKIGGTPLHNAANKEIAELLISKGADVNAKDEYGDTPLDWAIQFREPEIADLLRKHGGKTGEELEAEGK